MDEFDPPSLLLRRKPGEKSSELLTNVFCFLDSEMLPDNNPSILSLLQNIPPLSGCSYGDVVEIDYTSLHEIIGAPNGATYHMRLKGFQSGDQESTIEPAHHLDWECVALGQEPLLSELVVIDPWSRGTMSLTILMSMIIPP